MIWDHKSQLQEYCQSHKIKLYYQLKQEKRIKHQQFFLVEVILENYSLNETKKASEKTEILRGSGMGRTKKEAEQEAAKEVLAKMGVVQGKK
jgi:ribonuclease III